MPCFKKMSKKQKKAYWTTGGFKRKVKRVRR